MSPQLADIATSSQQPANEVDVTTSDDAYALSQEDSLAEAPEAQTQIDAGPPAPSPPVTTTHVSAADPSDSSTAPPMYSPTNSNCPGSN